MKSIINEGGILTKPRLVDEGRLSCQKIAYKMFNAMHGNIPINVELTWDDVKVGDVLLEVKSNDDKYDPYALRTGLDSFLDSNLPK
ncbi:MAG: hypothetical protein ABIC04_07405 [Nanoarchaeota archaeon]